MLFHTLLVLAALLCSLVGGFLFAFAVVVMPGIKRLDDGGFIRAFQVIDGVIQNNQPLFVLVWLGSALALIAAAVLGVFALAGVDRVLLVVAALAYVLGVQLPTFTINIPLNKRLQSVDVDGMDASAQTREREAFEGRWNRWNDFRTVITTLVTFALLVLLLRL